MPASGLATAAICVVVITTIAIVGSILVWLIRLLVRTKIHGPWGWDDTHCTIATVLGIINSSITLSQVDYGLGRHINDISKESIHRQFLLA